MAQQGLHLKKLNLLQLWTFVRGDADNVVCRVDFNNKWEKADYRQLLEDAGWERDLLGRLAVLAHESGQRLLA